jgi:carotenoid cleavage dioxygenase-like enzyme
VAGAWLMCVAEARAGNKCAPTPRSCAAQIEGKLPKGLRGTLLRNGPGLFEVGGKRVDQPFDGDG